MLFSLASLASAVFTTETPERGVSNISVFGCCFVQVHLIMRPMFDHALPAMWFEIRCDVRRSDAVKHPRALCLCGLSCGHEVRVVGPAPLHGNRRYPNNTLENQIVRGLRPDPNPTTPRERLGGEARFVSPASDSVR